MNEKKPPAPAEPRNEEPQGAVSAKNNLPMLIGLLVCVLLFEAGLGVIIVKAAGAARGGAPNDSAEDRVKTEAVARSDDIDMGPTTVDAPIDVVVNIAGTEGDRLLKATIVLEYKDRGDSKAAPEKGKSASPIVDALNERMPKYKSFLIDYLSKMTLPELSVPGARDKIRKDLLREINSTLPAKFGWVKNVYFTEYIIQ